MYLSLLKKDKRVISTSLSQLRKPLFGWLPIETLIKERQDEYYRVLGECDHKADSGEFIELMLQAIYCRLLSSG